MFHMCKRGFNFELQLKGHLTTSASSPIFFFKKVEIFIPLEVYTYVVTACLILLVTSTYEDMWIFLVAAIFKSLLLKVAATVMTVEFGTSHHYSRILKLQFVQFFEQIQKLTEHFVNYDILV